MRSCLLCLEDGLGQMAEISPRLAVGELPAFHTLGMITQLLFPILIGGTACIYPLASSATEYSIPVSPTAENTLENAKRAKATGIVSVPALIMEWQSAEDVAYLKTLKLLVSVHFRPPNPLKVGKRNCSDVFWGPAHVSCG